MRLFRCFNPVFVEPVKKGGATESQKSCRLCLVALRHVQGLSNQVLLDFFEVNTLPVAE